MKPDKIIDAMQHIDEDMLEEVNRARQKKRTKRKRTKQWIKWGSMAAGLALVLIISGRQLLLNDQIKSTTDYSYDNSGKAQESKAEEKQETSSEQFQQGDKPDKEDNAPKEDNASKEDEREDKQCLPEVDEDSPKAPSSDDESKPREKTLDIRVEKIEKGMLYGYAAEDSSDGAITKGDKVCIETEIIEDETSELILNFFYKNRIVNYKYHYHKYSSEKKMYILIRKE